MANLVRSDASSTKGGELTSGTQTIAGAKTFNESTTFRALGGTVNAGSYDTSGAWTLGSSSNTNNSVTIPNNGFITSSTSDAADNRSLTISGGGGGTSWNQNRGAGIVLQGNEVSGAEGEAVYYAGNAGGSFSRHRFVAGGVNVGTCSKDGVWVFGPTSGINGANHTFQANNTSAINSFVPVLQVANNDVTSNSDNNYCMWLTKGSTNATSTQKFVRFSINNGSTNSGTIGANGADSAAFQGTSDARLKTNIADLTSQIGNIMSLRPVTFDRADMDATGQTGFIAQEMQSIYPDVVSADPNGILSITGWDKTSARIVKAIQELKAELDAAKAEIQILKGN